MMREVVLTIMTAPYKYRPNVTREMTERHELTQRQPKSVGGGARDPRVSLHAPGDL